jgi:hypothetical protein
MPYNLYHENDMYFVPEDTEMTLQSVQSSIGYIHQFYEGIFNEDGEFITDFNVQCYVYKDLLTIQIIDITENKIDSSVTQFCSLIPEDKYTLPKAVFQACEHVKSNYSIYAKELFHLIISLVGIKLFEDDLISEELCIKKANLLYQLVNLKRSSSNTKQPTEQVEFITT